MNNRMRKKTAATGKILELHAQHQQEETRTFYREVALQKKDDDVE